ncbi:MAG: IS1595 family transposase, partial [Albidovulum sp.]|nr:IS1595 family transposase [Albidovulum sp.]
MAKRNLAQFQKGMSITMFLKDFGTEEKCAEALAKLRCPRDSNAP